MYAKFIEECKDLNWYKSLKIVEVGKLGKLQLCDNKIITL